MTRQLTELTALTAHSRRVTIATNSGAEVTEFRKYLYKIPEAMILLSMSRSTIYEQIRSGRLRSVQQGRARLIPAVAIHDYVACLEREAQEETHYDETA